MNSLLILIVIIISLVGILIAFLPREFWDSLWDNLNNFPLFSATISLGGYAGLSWGLHGILNNEISSVVPAIIAPILAAVLVFGDRFSLGIMFGFLGAKIIYLGFEYYKSWLFWLFFISSIIAIFSSAAVVGDLNQSRKFNSLQQYLVVTGISWIGLMLGLLFLVN